MHQDRPHHGLDLSTLDCADLISKSILRIIPRAVRARRVALVPEHTASPVTRWRRGASPLRADPVKSVYTSGSYAMWEITITCRDGSRLRLLGAPVIMLR